MGRVKVGSELGMGWGRVGDVGRGEQGRRKDGRGWGVIGGWR